MRSAKNYGRLFVHFKHQAVIQVRVPYSSRANRACLHGRGIG
ncbi:hypothetical protein BDW27_12229 [Nocardiopsis sp. L17-MgMaSL7]|nr:hypothetical protein BDW27_12229 [Nocardiopsis sp. L17-MgMaSL7]